MVKVRDDLTGKVFGRLTVLEQTDDYINPCSGDHVARWLCECSCEKHSRIKVVGTQLKSGMTQSCGCKKQDIRLNDLTGMVFGSLRVIRRAPSHITPNGTSKVMWECVCNACGKTNVIVSSEHLKNGQTSCGCLRSQICKETATTHGKSHTRLYGIWCAMKRRCYDPKNARYNSYGARGIVVCEEWKNSYETFYNWAISNGYDENAPRGMCTIERKDVNKNYCPENCIWATNKEQANNTRTNRIITIDGVSRTISQWAEYTGLRASCISTRINKLGWSEYDAVMTPKGGKRNVC